MYSQKLKNMRNKEHLENETDVGKNIRQITRHINRLYLDPNNYRFIDKPEYQKVPESMITDLQVQKRTRFLLTGKNNELIQDLLASFKENGFLPVNQIQVKELSGGNDDDKRYLVLEGNRRIAALKYLYEEWREKGADIGKLTESSFRSVTVVLHPGESRKEHLIIMGLDHITGKRRWSPLNQAQLIEDLIHEHQMSEDEICQALGISKIILRRTRRTLALISCYRHSDYGDQFTGSMYSFFEEIIKNPRIKEWLAWNDMEMRPENIVNQERLFSWLSRDEVIERDESGEEILRKIQEPIITRALDIRELAKYIHEPAALEKMETTRSITEGFVVSDAVGETKFLNALNKLKQDVSTVFNFSEYMLPEHVEDIQKLRAKFDRLLPATNHHISPYTGLSPLFQEELSGYFTELRIASYRKLQGLQLKRLNRINIVAGKNNSGKTSLLEAVFLLSQLNDLNAFLESERYRGKFHESFNPKWLARNASERFKISGKLDELKVSVSFLPQQTTEHIDKSGYLASLVVEAEIGDEVLESSVHLFSDRAPEMFYQRSNILCHAAMTSPYRYNEGLLKKAHAVAVRERFLDDIISFIRTHIDPDLVRIEMVNIEGESRFYVHTNVFKQSFDMSKYGEGVQRVFEIALLLGYCRNGILCIDEFESAIHKSLLIDFSRFVHQLADRFKVQVFLTTHSKECIDAFIENQYKNEEITAYALRETPEGSIEGKYVHGKRLENLLQSINLDIRG